MEREHRLGISWRTYRESCKRPCRPKRNSAVLLTSSQPSSVTRGAKLLWSGNATKKKRLSCGEL
jgi:hypothetical protein